MPRVASFPASPGCVKGARVRRATGATALKSLPISSSLSSSTSVTARSSCSTSSSSSSPSHSRNSDLRSTPFRPPGRKLSPVATRALAPDAPPDWTLDQIAGLVFGLGMMASFLLAYRVDSAVARQQRRDLGLCEACGGLNERGSCREKGCPMK